MNKREMRERLGAIKLRQMEIMNGAREAKRQVSKEETDELQALKSEKECLRSLLDEDKAPAPSEELQRSAAFAEAVLNIRSNANQPDAYRDFANSKEIIIPVTRAIQDSSTVNPIIPLTVGEIIEPLEKGLILDKVGCKMQSGLTGDWILPVVAAVEATIEEENAEVADTTINISDLKPSPKRVSIAIPVSNFAIDRSNGVLISKIVLPQIHMAVQRLLNKWMFQTTKITAKATDGCFVAAAATPAVEFKNTPSYKDVVALEASVLEKGVLVDGTAAYVCSASMYAALKTTPKDAGSGLFIAQDGKINGYPVYITEYIGKDVLGFGVFQYQLVGQFGNIRMTVDPYTGSKRDITYFVFNTNFDLKSVRTEAFAIAKKNAALPASLSVEGGETPAANPTEGGETPKK